MSTNKLKYYTVTTTATVAANNKTDAAALSRGRRGVTGRVLDSSQDIQRISAAEAKGGLEQTA